LRMSSGVTLPAKTMLRALCMTNSSNSGLRFDV
jgi:hypothetical protein